jgi:peptide/nickel transport system permease protein
MITMFIAALGAWFGGWVDGLIQRMTEVNLILPVFPVLLIVYNFYSKSLWVLLGVMVLFSVFGSAIKTYRAAFLQVKESPYIEAARSYGASGARIVLRYLAPRVAPILIPQLVALVPTYVFLEATLSFLNMADPNIPTWGRLIREGINEGALTDAYHWVLEPAGLLLLVGFAFLMVGFALERIFNPRLRERL